jgi:hypothetical protein
MNDTPTPRPEVCQGALDDLIQSELTPAQYDAFCLWSATMRAAPRRFDRVGWELDWLLFTAAFDEQKKAFLTDRFLAIYRGEPDPDRPAPVN